MTSFKSAGQNCYLTLSQCFLHSSPRMSATPTPSVSSVQTCYYDALPVMQFSLHADNASGEGLGSSFADSCPGGENVGFSKRKMAPLYFAASGNPSSTNQPPHTEGTGSASKHVDDEAGQRTPSLRSLPVEPEGKEKQIPAMKTTLGGTSSALGRVGSARTTRSAHTPGATSAFANGAPLMGPNAEPDVDQSLFVRGAKAERSLSQKQKGRIAKEESAFSNRNQPMALTQK